MSIPWKHLGILLHHLIVLTRHDKADLLIHRLALLADLGVKVTDPGIKIILKKVVKVKDTDGIIQIRIKIPKVFGGEDKPEWMWTMCDFPHILYAIQKMGVPEDEYKEALTTLILPYLYEYSSGISLF